MKILVAILFLYINIIYVYGGSCGQYGKKLENEKCLCAAYTLPNHRGYRCANATGICTPPTSSFVGQNERYTLKLTTRSLNFVGENLVVVLEYPPIPTGLTDITVFTKNGTSLTSLSDGISGANTLGNWTHTVDNTGVSCAQLATWVVNWQELAPLVKRRRREGYYAFDLTASTHIIREKSKLSIRSVDLAPSILVDVVPVSIDFDQIVSTKNYVDRVVFNLDYDVKLNYFLKKLHLDPTTLKVRATLEHGISFPLSLRSQNLVVSINGVPVPARSYEKENKVDCPAKKGSVCLSKTIILFQLPFQPNCTEYQLDIDLDLESKCHGVNDHTSKYLCYGLKKSLSQQSVHVNLPIKYNFCPKIETTEVSVSSFQLKQKDDILVGNEILARDDALQGAITLQVLRIFKGSVFTAATISSIRLVESSTSATPASYDITDVSTLVNGKLTSPNTIDISFTYIPSYQQISTHLQNWTNGFFVQVTIDISFYSPQGITPRNDGQGPIHTSVRLQIPQHSLPSYLKRDHVVASSSALKLDHSAVKKSIEQHELVKTKIQTEKLSDQLKMMQKNNQTMIYLIIASVAGCFIVLMIGGILIYKFGKSSQQQEQIQN